MAVRHPAPADRSPKELLSSSSCSPAAGSSHGLQPVDDRRAGLPRHCLRFTLGRMEEKGYIVSTPTIRRLAPAASRAGSTRPRLGRHAQRRTGAAAFDAGFADEPAWRSASGLRPLAQRADDGAARRSRDRDVQTEYADAVARVEVAKPLDSGGRLRRVRESHRLAWR